MKKQTKETLLYMAMYAISTLLLIDLVAHN